MCHPQCVSVSSMLWLLQSSDKVCTCIVPVCANGHLCSRGHTVYNYTFYVLCICVTTRWGVGMCLCSCICVYLLSGSHKWVCNVWMLLCVQRGCEGIYFYECVCMFVFIVAEGRLCCGQNNLPSRCAEARGKSIKTMAPNQMMSMHVDVHPGHNAVRTEKLWY